MSEGQKGTSDVVHKTTVWNYTKPFSPSIVKAGIICKSPKQANISQPIYRFDSNAKICGTLSLSVCSYVEKFTDFLRLFVSVHLRRIESNAQFPVVEFLALFFKYTFNQVAHSFRHFVYFLHVPLRCSQGLLTLKYSMEIVAKYLHNVQVCAYCSIVYRSWGKIREKDGFHNNIT